MVETALAVVKFTLSAGIPVDFLVTERFKSNARSMSEFGTIYTALGSLRFEVSPPLSPLSILTHLLNDASGNINAIIITARLDHDLSERILNATSNGHSITVLFFASSDASTVSEKIFQLLVDSGISAFCINDEFSFVN